MTNADPEVVARINELGDQVARLELEEETLVKDIESRKRAIDEESAPRLQRIKTAVLVAKQELAMVIESINVSGAAMYSMWASSPSPATLKSKMVQLSHTSSISCS